MSERETAAPAVVEKQRIRAWIRARRSALTAGERTAAATALGRRITAIVAEHGARSVSCYLPLGPEPDTRVFLDRARKQGVEVLLPVSRPDGALDWAHDTGRYAAGAFGIREPVGERLGTLAVAGVDLMLIPACAVDEAGFRLGWGRGYFDRCLAALDAPPPVYAVLYDAELLRRVPREAHDMPVAGAVTPARTVRFSR